MNGKGSAPRNCFSEQFKENYDQIDWNKKKMKIGIIFCAFNTKDYLAGSLAPWIEVREKSPEGTNFIIHAVSVPFKDFKVEEEDGTQAELHNYVLENKIDNALCRNDAPIAEIEARTLALKALITKGVDAVWQVDSDEFYTVNEISRILKFVNDRPNAMMYRGSFKNFVFTEKECAMGVFAPARIHRIHGPGDYTAELFYDDNNIAYKSVSLNRLVRDLDFPTLSIPKGVAWTKHLTWLNNERSRKKILYQQSRGWNCTFAWDDSKGGLIWNPNIPPPETIIET